MYQCVAWVYTVASFITIFQMALSHMTLLQEWRDRAGQGQSEARRVIAEMLTPSGM